MDRANTDDGLSARAARIATLARTAVKRVRLLGWLGLASAAWLWLVLFVFVGAIPNFLLAVPAALISVTLLLPGAVVLLTTVGLNSLGQLPRRLGANAPVASTTPCRKERRSFSLLRKLWAIRGEILDHKLTLIRYAGAVRLFTLPVLLAISLAVLACVFQIALAAFSLPLMLVVAAL